MRKALGAHGFAEMRNGLRVPEKILKAHVLSLDWISHNRRKPVVPTSQPGFTACGKTRPGGALCQSSTSDADPRMYETLHVSWLPLPEG
jgi:hypothetical protein